jgi:hypothetical protein
VTVDGVITAKVEEEGGTAAALLAGGDRICRTSKSLSGCSPTSVGYGGAIPRFNAFLSFFFFFLVRTALSVFVCIVDTVFP